MANIGRFAIGDQTVAPGTRETVALPVSVLADHTPVNMTVHVVHGRKSGPTLFVSAAVHGDEIIGVEIARRLLQAPHLERICGTLMVVPIVNTFGFLNRSRYLPDRRDLNRSFPGFVRGSLASRLAYLFMNEIIGRSDFGIDLHSAAVNRVNLPQVRISPSTEKTLDLARAFGAPVILAAKLRDGSMRMAAHERGVDVLLYEAGEGMRFDEYSVRTGTAGILRVMQAMKMIPSKGVSKARAMPLHSTDSSWLRAPVGGLLRTFKITGEQVTEGDLLGIISDPVGANETQVTAANAGVIVGRTVLPVVNEGDALFHIAEIAAKDAETTIESLAQQIGEDPLFDEDEII